MGYPIYGNTVVFHSTPDPADVLNKIIYGLDAETGKEKWRLTNKDFYPKEKLRLFSLWYFYQYNNILVCCDNVNDLTGERYIYAIDIEKGKVLWVNELPPGYNDMGRMVIGRGKTAYIDAQQDMSKFTLFRIDVETGSYSTAFSLTEADIPVSIPNRYLSFFQATQVYQNHKGEDLVACSFESWDTNQNSKKGHGTLLVYNLTQNQVVYATHVNKDTPEDDWDIFYGRVLYHNGKLLVGKSSNLYCFDAFEESPPLWQRSTALNNGDIYGNDSVFQLLAYEDFAIVYCADRIMCLNFSTGYLNYNVSSRSGSAAGAIIDGVLYCEDNNDFLMRDPRTGKELKRISSGENQEGFTGSRPNGADGRIYIHTYTDAYCIRAWGE